MKLTKTILLALSVLLIISELSSQAQTDTIRLNKHNLLTGQLKPGLKQYLVYFQNPGQHKMLNLSLWTRDIQVIQHQGERCFSIVQKWFGNDTASYRTVKSINRKKDFSALYHEETIRGQLRAYNWFADRITGDTNQAANLQKGFSIQLDQPYYNWNLDIETYEMLPLASGKSYVLPLYDAGSGKPVDVKFKVEGSEQIATLDQQKVDCWILLTEGQHGEVKYTQRYWISKKNHEFLMEEDAYNGMYRYKVKLPAYAPNFINRFK